MMNNETRIQPIQIAAESIEADCFKNICDPFKISNNNGKLPVDGKFYYYEFSPKCLILISATDVIYGNRVIGAGLDEKIAQAHAKTQVEILKNMLTKRFC